MRESGPEIQLEVNGAERLSGAVQISGAKNAALPELAAVILSRDAFVFQNVPHVEDVKVLFRALENLGAEGVFQDRAIEISLSDLRCQEVPADIVKSTRASVLMLGPLLARNGFAHVSLPGGCSIGARQINFHLDGLRRMGASILVENGYITARSEGLRGIEYTFPGISVTGTEHLLMAACLAEGTTVLSNCAREPEVIDLVALLRKMGALIENPQPGTYQIQGVTSLAGAVHRVIPDRIEQGTYLIAACLEDYDITIENGVPEFNRGLLSVLEQMGVRVSTDGGVMRVNRARKLTPVEVDTEPFPGFATDLQAQLTILLTQIPGVSRIRENIFDNRFQHVPQLNKLGADIRIQDKEALISGKKQLLGGEIAATDLRASAAMVLGGLIAQGTTRIVNAYQLFRGYEDMPGKLTGLGAKLRIHRLEARGR